MVRTPTLFIKRELRLFPPTPFGFAPAAVSHPQLADVERRIDVNDEVTKGMPTSLEQDGGIEQHGGDTVASRRSDAIAEHVFDQRMHDSFQIGFRSRVIFSCTENAFRKLSAVDRSVTGKNRFAESLSELRSNTLVQQRSMSRGIAIN